MKSTESLVYTECALEQQSSAMMNVLRSTRVRGSVRAYTRHVSAYPYAGDPTTTIADVPSGCM